MIYVFRQNEYFINTKGCTFIRVALLTSEELEELLSEGVMDFAATPEAAEIIRNIYGVNIPKVFQGQPPVVKKGDKIILLGEGQAVDITLVW